MDWSKAKTILIIVFLLLNIFLMTTIFYTNSSLRFQSDYTKYAKDYLASKEITLKGSIPSGPAKAGTLDYIAKTYDFKKITAKVFGHEVTQSIANNAVLYAEGEEEISLTGDILIIHDRISEGSLLYRDPEKFAEESMNYLADIGYSRSSLYIENQAGNGDEKSLLIGQMYNNGVLFDLPISVSLTPNGLLKVSAPAKEVKKVNRQFDIISPYQLLVMSNLTNRSTIKKIEFGYHRLSEGEIYDSPIWRITMDDNSFIYYDAQKGEKLK
ncbi:MAG: two-component system regulatory protein YycI [Clostridia bacterium]|nr:two-component system regulatory protein YycI [Clostridia bacterium]